MESVSRNIQKNALEKLEYGSVRIRDEFLLHSFDLERKYLLSLDMDRLLAGFMETAGQKTAAKRYEGWESTQIQGHTMGHYLTALSQAWASTGDEIFKERVDYLVEKLAECQRADGYLFASGEELFDWVEDKKPAWVPWYTMHKLLSGLVSVCKYTENKKGYTVMANLADWVSGRALSWSDKVRDNVLAVEYGGMNDVLYDIYALTGNTLYMRAAHRFDEMKLFQSMEQREDILNGLHANTTIPKILGGLKRYFVTGQKETFYLHMAQNFWDMVVSHHTYITGGNSEWEHFGHPDILDAERTACNCETCNSYNMLKLTSLLFMATGEKQYADYDERTYVNAILSSQNHETGMTTYFQPMASGYFKVYSTPYNKFWCCTGTGMENFTKHVENIYYCGENILYINRFFASEVQWEEQNLTLKVEGNLLREETFRIRIQETGITDRKLAVQKDTDENIDQVSTIAIRQPEWMAYSVLPKVSSQSPCEVTEEEGFWKLKKCWREGDIIELSLPMQMQVHGLPDADNVAAFTYGPFVLSADFGSFDMKESSTGVDVTVPTKSQEIIDSILLDTETYQDWKGQIGARLKKTDGKMEFQLMDAKGQKFIFAPHFLKNQVRYGIYFHIFENESEDYVNYRREQKRKQNILNNQHEVIPLGNDQYELAFHIQGHETDSVTAAGKRGRVASPSGWFSYEMQIPSKACCLNMTLSSQATSYNIYLDDTLWITDMSKQFYERGFYQKGYGFPEDVLGKRVRVKLVNTDKTNNFSIYNELYISELEENENECK